MANKIAFYPELTNRRYGSRLKGSSGHIELTFNIPFTDYENAFSNGEEYFSLAAAGGNTLIFYADLHDGFTLKCEYINGEKCSIPVDDFEQFSTTIAAKLGCDAHDMLRIFVLAGLCHDPDEAIMSETDCSYFDDDCGGEIPVEVLDDQIDCWRHPAPYYTLATIYVNLGVGEPDEMGCFEEYDDEKCEMVGVATFNNPEE